MHFLNKIHIQYALKFKQIIKYILEFTLGQGMVQIINTFTAFLLLRWVPKYEYGLFTLGFTLFSTFSTFIEAGINNSLIPLIGKKIKDKNLIASYIQSAHKLRNKFTFYITPLFLIVYCLFFFKHNTDTITLLISAALILISIFYTGTSSYYSIPLIINKKIKQKYLPELIGATSRLGLSIILYKFDYLNFCTLIGLFLTTLLIKHYYYKIKSKEYLKINNFTDKTKQIKNYIKPIIPIIIFNAFQSQILIFLIAFFNQTKDIANFGALLRFNQFFLFTHIFIKIIIGPWIAKQSDLNLKRNIILIIIFSSILSLCFGGLPYLIPQPFQFILGSKYHDIFNYIPFYILIFSTSSISHVINTINLNRKYVYFKTSIIKISSLIIVDVICAIFLDLSDLNNYIYFNGIIFATNIIISLSILCYGLKTTK